MIWPNNTRHCPLALLLLVLLVSAPLPVPASQPVQPASAAAASHFTRGVPSAERNSDIMAHYQRKQDEYRLMVNCSPSLAKPQAYDVDSRSPHRAPSYQEKLSWLNRPQETAPISRELAPLLAVEVAAPACTQARSLSLAGAATAAGASGDAVAFADAGACGVARTAEAIRGLLPAARLLVLFNGKDPTAPAPDDAAAAAAASAAAAQSSDGADLHILHYDQTELGRRLLAEMRGHENRSCVVSVFYRAGGYDSLINKTSVLFVSVSFILLMIISLSWLVFYYVQRFRYLHAKERLSRRLGNAAKKALTRIPVKVLKTGDKDFHWIGDQCAVCIEPYRCGESVRILPCRHFYHKSCIDPWLLDQRSCPLCKLDILKACGLHIHRGSQASLLDGQLSAEHSHAAAAAAAVSSPNLPGSSAGATAAASSTSTTAAASSLIPLSRVVTVQARWSPRRADRRAASPPLRLPTVTRTRAASR